MVDKTVELEVAPVIKVVPSFTFSSATKCCDLADGRRIIHAVISKRQKNQFQICSAKKMALDKTSFDAIGLSQYIGSDPEDVTTAFPELAGTTEVDGESRPNFTQNTWMQEKYGEIAGYFVVESADHSKFKMIVKSTKEIAVVAAKITPEYATEKVWVDAMITAKEVELKEIADTEIISEKVIL